jgi:hypothetical protein
VGENAKISTGSGNIHATGLRGGFTVRHRLGQHLRRADRSRRREGVRPARAISSCAICAAACAPELAREDIKAGGAPSADWKLETGSGNVELWPGNAGLTLDASTGSGSIHTDHEICLRRFTDRHHVSGKLNGGGPTVRIETGSGDIRVH